MKRTTLRLVGSALVALCWVPAAMAQTTESPPVQFTRAYDAGGLLPSSAQQYAAIEEARLMQLLTEFIDISRRYRDAGHPQFWGRIMGTESDVESAEWIMDKYRQAGLTDVRRQALELPPQWMPQSWTVTASAGGRSLDVAAVHPTYLSPDTPPDGLDLEAVYVGLGRAPDLVQTPDVRGKAVFFVSDDPTARTSRTSDEAYRRLSDRGAAAIFGINTLPGNMRIQGYPVNSTAPALRWVVRMVAVLDLIADDPETPVRVQVHLDVRMVSDLTTSTVWGTVPGATDETIYILAHRDGWFDAATDNATGVATQVTLAEYFASMPRAERRRTIHFLGTSGHHNADVIGPPNVPTGPTAIWLAAHLELFEKAALLINSEHTGARQTGHGSPRLGNAPSLLRWFASDARLAEMVIGALDAFGVTTYAESVPPLATELRGFWERAPTAYVLSSGFVFHTDHETAETVSGPEMVAVTRAYAKLIDEVNKVDLSELRASIKPR